MAKNTANYGNDSIRQLKDEERVRLRPAVIFGSDGLDDASVEGSLPAGSGQPCSGSGCFPQEHGFWQSCLKP